MRLSITGYPIPEPLVIDGAQSDRTIFGTGWLLTQPQAEAIVTAWATAPTDPSPTGDDDVRRAWHYSPVGVFVTALYLDGELSLSEWESATGAEGDDHYSTEQMPFDFELAAEPEPADLEPRAGDIRRFTFTPVGGEPVTFTAEYAACFSGEVEPCIGYPEAADLLDAWHRVDVLHRHYGRPGADRGGDVAVVAFSTSDGEVVLDWWRLANNWHGYSLATLPRLLPGHQYTLTEAGEPGAEPAAPPTQPEVEAGQPPLAPPVAGRAPNARKSPGRSLGS